MPRTDSDDTAMAEAFKKAGWDMSGISPGQDDCQAETSTSIASRVSGLRIEPEDELNLHGHTQVEAHKRLKEFIEENRLIAARVVLVITGKGTGTLKRLVPLWLETMMFSEWVRETRPAESRHGGEGAVYVFLRERRR